MKILIIEDDQDLQHHTQTQFEKAGFGVDVASTSQQAQEMLDVNSYDCILLDLNLPDGNGFALCTQLRQSGNTTPIIIMTARDAISDKIKGLELGADDYVLKPVDSGELIARVKALIRRNSKVPLPTLTIGDLIINTQTQRVTRASTVIPLPTKEYAVLELLARHSDEVVTRAMLMEHIWGSDFETFSNVIDVYIRNLRKKLDQPFEKKLLHTIRGGGYSLSDLRN